MRVLIIFLALMKTKNKKKPKKLHVRNETDNRINTTRMIYKQIN